MTITPLKLSFCLVATVRLVLMSSALRSQRSILRYDAESSDVFTSAVLDHSTGALYVSDAGTRSVRRFTASLQLEAEYPLTVLSACDEGRRAKVTRPSDVGVLTLDPVSGLLLACGGHCGLCSLLNTSIDAAAHQQPRVLDPTKSASYVASRVRHNSPVMVFSAPGNSTDDDDNNATSTTTKLFVAGATAPDLEAVSVRSKTSASDDFDVLGARSFSSPSHSDSYEFIDALDAGDGFIYFVAVRRQPAAETRLIRVCRDDTGRLDSYAELKLSCLSPTALTSPLNVAVAAHIAPVGADLARRFQFDAGEPAIYLVAERNDGNHPTSGVCVYTLRQVSNSIVDAVLSMLLIFLTLAVAIWVQL